MEDPEHRRLGETNERLISFTAEAADFDRFVTVWENLTIREHRMVTHSLARLIAHMRIEISTSMCCSLLAYTEPLG